MAEDVDRSTYDEVEAVPIVRRLSILDCRGIGWRVLIADNADEAVDVVVDAMRVLAEVECSNLAFGMAVGVKRDDDGTESLLALGIVRKGIMMSMSRILCLAILEQ